MRQIIDTGEYVNRNLLRYNRICAGAIFFTQVVSIFFYGFFIRPASSLPTARQLSDLYSSTGVSLLVLIGFGLLFSPAKNNIWSSIGFTFFITVISIHLFHLFSGFWTLCGVTPFNFSMIWSYTIPVFLTDRNALNVITNGNTAIGAMRCALANAIAFAAIMGRGGLLQAFIMTLFGTVVYEINRQLIQRYCLDFGGSIGIFCWGAIYGSIVSLISYFRKHKRTAQENESRVGGKFSYTLVGMGSLFCWVFFPFLNNDIPVTLAYSYQAVINCIYSMCASVLTAIGLSCLFTGKLNLKDFIYGPIVGAVIIGSSAAFITNTVGALLMGVGAGTTHFLLHRWEARIKWYFLIENNVLFLYGVQGMMGGLLSSIFVKLAQNSNSGLFSSTNVLYVLPSFSGQLIATGISMATATGIGLFVGFIIAALTQERRLDHYHDRAYWIIQQDGISEAEDIHFNSQIDLSESQDEEIVTEKHVEVYRQVIIPPERGFKNKFAEL